MSKKHVYFCAKDKNGEFDPYTLSSSESNCIEYLILATGGHYMDGKEYNAFIEELKNDGWVIVEVNIVEVKDCSSKMYESEIIVEDTGYGYEFGIKANDPLMGLHKKYFPQALKSGKYIVVIQKTYKGNCWLYSNTKGNLITVEFIGCPSFVLCEEGFYEVFGPELCKELTQLPTRYQVDIEPSLPTDLRDDNMAVVTEEEYFTNKEHQILKSEHEKYKQLLKEIQSELHYTEGFDGRDIEDMLKKIEKVCGPI